MSPDKVEARPTNLCSKEITMTIGTMALAEHAENGTDVDVLRQMVQFMGQRLMELDVEGRAAPAATRRTPSESTVAMATASVPGKRVPARSS